MSDDKTKVGEPDRRLISLSEDHEVRYWTQALNISEERLRNVVKKVGNSADKVREELRG